MDRAPERKDMNIWEYLSQNPCKSWTLIVILVGLMPTIRIRYTNERCHTKPAQQKDHA